MHDGTSLGDGRRLPPIHRRTPVDGTPIGRLGAIHRATLSLALTTGLATRLTTTRCTSASRTATAAPIVSAAPAAMMLGERRGGKADERGHHASGKESLCWVHD